MQRQLNTLLHQRSFIQWIEFVLFYNENIRVNNKKSLNDKSAKAGLKTAMTKRSPPQEIYHSILTLCSCSPFLILIQMPTVLKYDKNMLPFSKKKYHFKHKTLFTLRYNIEQWLERSKYFYERWHQAKKKLFSFKASLSIFPIQKIKKNVNFDWFWLNYFWRHILSCSIALNWISGQA